MEKIILKIPAVVLIISLIIMLVGGLFMVSKLKKDVLEPDSSVEKFDLKVVDIGNQRITLKKAPETKSNQLKKEGFWGLRWEDSYGQVGRILDVNEEEVTREYVPMKGILKEGDMVRLDAFAYPDNPDEAFGISSSKVFYSSSIGSFPARYFKGSKDTWIIFVHGKRHYPTRPPYRSYPTLPLVFELGFPTLIITYRNDLGVQKNPDGYHWYGLTEWEDLEGAAKYAIEAGAKDLILIGYSMGGGIVMNFMYESGLVEKVKGLILDAPMLDLNATVEHGARGLNVPGFLVSIGKHIAKIRFGIDWKKLNYLKNANKLNVPILLFHGDDDKTVPHSTSDMLAKERPDIVKYHCIRGATHVRSWNMSPTKYENVVREFLMKIDEKTLSEVESSTVENQEKTVNLKNWTTKSLNMELTDKINQMIQKLFRIDEKEPAEEYEGKKTHINVIIEDSVKDKDDYIIGARFETSFDGKLMTQLTGGAIGIGKSAEDAQQALLKEWTIQYGLPWVNYLKQKDGFQFKGYTIYTGPTIIRFGSPNGWLRDNEKMHTTILEAIGVEIISNSGITPAAINLNVTVNETGKFKAECRLNGQVSEDILNKLHEVDWPKSETGYMLKQFYLVVEKMSQPVVDRNISREDL